MQNIYIDWIIPSNFLLGGIFMPKRKNLVGNIYGELKVIEMLYNYKNKKRTYCKCIGINDMEYREYIVRQDSLQSGATKSTNGACTAGKKHDLTGKRFGLLVALEPLYTDKHGHVIWNCLCDCGNYTSVSQPSLEHDHTLSCGCRHSSKWEMFISEYLKSLNIDFKFQKRFTDCKNDKGSDMLPFDFYIPSKNIIIEYDGLHHFESIKGWGGKEKFKITQRNDEIKNTYCKDNNITLIRIPYTYAKEEIIQTINNILSPATITA